MKEKGLSICITSAKGGVGKTFLTLNLAGLYEILNKKVLIIDFDLTGGGIAASLNLDVNKSVFNFVDDYNNNRYKNFYDYVTKYDDNIDVLASPKDPRQANKINNKYVEIILDKAIFNYDIVLIDTNNNLTDFNILTLDLVDKLLFVMSNDLIDAKNMRNLIAVFKDVNYNNYKVILNESINPSRSYLSLFDIKNIIRNNVDYLITSSFYIKNIDSFIVNGEIVTLQPKASSVFSKDYTTLMQIVTDMHD